MGAHLLRRSNQPAQGFDFNMQQYSITPEREMMIDFSEPYYSSAMAVLTTGAVVDGGAEATIASLKGLKWGAVATTTTVPMIAGLIAPDDPLLYGDNTDVTAALQAGQIDALFDLPRSLSVGCRGREWCDPGQFPADRSEAPDQFGLLMEDGNALKECVMVRLPH